MTGKARMDAYSDRIAETERVKERKKLELSEVQAMCQSNLVVRSGWRIDMRSHLARTRDNTKRTK